MTNRDAEAPPPHRALRSTARAGWLTLVLFVAFVATLAGYVLAEKRIDRANNDRHLSFRLAYELKLSSEELTRAARTFAVTGDPVWKARFDEVLDIRDGRVPRPAQWGMLGSVAGGAAAAEAMGAGRRVALLDLMRAAGFTGEELALLSSAKENSDRLTRIEREAMVLVASGSTADRERAVAMLHGPAYHAAKAAIMEPIERFIATADQRTVATVDAAVATATAWRLGAALVGLALLASIWRGRRQLLATLGGPADEVYRSIARLGRGDFETPVAAAGPGSDSVLAWLGEMRRELAELDAGRRRAESGQRRLNRTLRVLGECNLALAEARDESGYLDAVCRSIVGTGDYRMAWVGYAENDPGRHVRPVAQAGDRDGFLDQLQISWDDASPTGRGPTAVAINSGRTQVNQDFESNPRMGPWRDAALQRGLRSSIALPLAGAQGILGTLNLYSTQADAFDPQETELLEELARNVANGVEALRTREQRDRAQSASSAKSAFLAHMSHEIRTPLNAVVGLAELGASQAGGTPVETTLKALHEAGEHLMRVVNDILDFSRLEAGKLSVERQPFALSGVLSTVAGIGHAEARGKGLVFELEVPPDLPAMVIGDAHRLRQVLINLVGNAIKFTDAGWVRLSITREAGEDIAFAVTDTGIGMSPEQQSRLFRPFEQGDASTTRRYGGSGLGLAISHGLAQLMGGALAVRSVEGAGSTFTLRLPLPPAPEPPAEPRPAAQPKAGGRRLDGWRLLVGEDVEVNRIVIGAFLEREGAQVTFAENGLQVIGRIVERGNDAFDAVLMDVQMPLLDGLETTRRLRRIAPRLPVIGVTAHALPEERQRCIEAGMVDQVTKPVRIDELVTALRRCLPGKAGGSAPAG